MSIVTGWLLLAAWQNAGKGRVFMTLAGLVLAFLFARVG